MLKIASLGLYVTMWDATCPVRMGQSQSRLPARRIRDIIEGRFYGK